MIHAYFNYPNKHIEIHELSGCAAIQQQRKKRQRFVKIKRTTFSREVKKFEGFYRFAAKREANDMWVQVDFGDIDFEVQVVAHLIKILSRRYRPFNGIKPKIHSCM